MRKKIGAYIRAKRRLNKKTIVDVASALDVSYHTTINIESGRSKISFEQAIKISRYLEFDINELIGIAEFEIFIEKNKDKEE